MNQVTRTKFLEEDKYIDYSAINIALQAEKLFADCNHDPIQITKTAYHYVRDQIMHSFDIEANIITAKASDVLRYGTGICHAKANLFAAFLRREGIPTGFCYQYLTLAEDDSKGYCLHAYNAVYLNEQWVKLDARGNKEGVQAHFSLVEPKLAFSPRANYKEHDCPGIYAKPHAGLMKVIDEAKTLDEVRQGVVTAIELGEPDLLD